MRVYIFGNEDLEFDNKAIKIAKALENTLEHCEFIYVKPNQDLPFSNEKSVVILDTVVGIEDVTLINDDQIQNISLEKITN